MLAQVVRSAVERNGAALEYASEELRGNRDIVLEVPPPPERLQSRKLPYRFHLSEFSDLRKFEYHE